jgi:hypothetical protein
MRLKVSSVFLYWGFCLPSFTLKLDFHDSEMKIGNPYRNLAQDERILKVLVVARRERLINMSCLSAFSQGPRLSAKHI